MFTLHPPPPPPLMIQHHHQQKRGICFHVDKPCFVLDAPKNKARLEYYKKRMRSAADISKSFDVKETLVEIKTGVKLSDRMRLSLTVYLLGVLIIFVKNGVL